ncbi:hypothetical protein OH77DRAFT_1428031 [Trametes cingulata]|nr:hypothetical protein OH77DRAFT_1428031 [Trametes cingulata]
MDRWEDRHEAEGQAANRALPDAAHHRPHAQAQTQTQPPRTHSPQPSCSPDRPSSAPLPRSRPNHRPPQTTSTAIPPPAAPLQSSSRASPLPATTNPHIMRLRNLLPLLHCPLCSPPALLRAPVTLQCGHTFCASHFAPSNAPSTSKAADTAPSLPTCPLPTCSSTSRAQAAFSHSPPLDVTVNKVIDILSAPQPEDPPPPPFHDDPDERTDSEYEVDSDSDLEYLPLPPQSPQSPASVASRAASSPVRDSETAGHVSRSLPSHADTRHRSRSRSQPSPRLPPRKRRRRLHHRVSPTSRPQPHRTDHDPQARLEKELLSELTCEICFGLLWQPLTTPCQHTFCTRCLFRSLDHSQSCPLCRQKLPGYDYFQQHPCNKVILAIILRAFPEAYAERGATIEAEERDARLDTPVFVCQLSFPGMPTMLHFFEPRYRLMLRRCLDSPHPCFGMIPPPRTAPSASASGSSTGNDYGTMLAIRNVQMLPDGRSLVETWGTWRFRIMERGTLDGYMVARIERIEDYEEELDEGAVATEEASENDRREDASGPQADAESARQSPGGAHTMGTQGGAVREEEQFEAAVRAELEDATTAAQAASSSSSGSRPGAIHASSSTDAAESSSAFQDRTSHPRPTPSTSEDKDKGAGDSGAVPPPSPQTQAPRAPTNAELMAKCHAFIDQMREGTPWVVQHLNNNYVPMPSDAASFSFWMALLLPIDEHEKAKLLPIRSPRLRLRLVVHWIEQLNSNWWFSGGCVVC